VSVRRDARRALKSNSSRGADDSDSGDDDGGEETALEEALVAEYCAQVEAEIELWCVEWLAMLNDALIPSVVDGNGEVKVFYLKMAGDCYRYLSEFITVGGYGEAAIAAYEQASIIAGTAMPPSHPLRLGLALNFSVGIVEIANDRARACDVAKTAFDAAIGILDELPEEAYADSTAIVALLRDNLSLWRTPTMENDADDVGA
jgi:14-3-3 protein epsilon